MVQRGVLCCKGKHSELLSQALKLGNRTVWDRMYRAENFAEHKHACIGMPNVCDGAHQNTLPLAPVPKMAAPASDGARTCAVELKSDMTHCQSPTLSCPVDALYRLLAHKSCSGDASCSTNCDDMFSRNEAGRGFEHGWKWLHSDAPLSGHQHDATAVSRMSMQEQMLMALQQDLCVLERRQLDHPANPEAGMVGCEVQCRRQRLLCGDHSMVITA